MVREENLGRVVEHWNAKEVAEVMRSLAASRARLVEWGENGRNLAGLYDQETVLRDFELVLEGVVAPRPRRLIAAEPEIVKKA